MKKKILLTSIFIIILFVFVCNIVVAQNIEDLQNKKNELQYQITEANEQINDIQIELTDNLEQLNKLNEKIGTYEQEIETLNIKLEEIQNSIILVSDKLDIIKQDYSLQRQTLETRLVALYEAGETKYLDVLLTSTSISEFISNYYLIAEIAEYDSDLLDNIERERASIETIQETLTQKKQSINTLKETKERTAIALENSKVLKDSYVKQLSLDEIATQEKIDAFQTELNSIESQIVLLTTARVGEDYVGGELDWPAPGYTTITSKFGMRFHPIFKINRMHSGTDIGMPTGAYIVAANDGIVLKAIYTTGYGNMVMIDHGGGVATVYGHGSEIIVQTGQEVKRGDFIMKAGSTGWSTGPHLHFEVRINGTCVDPLPYITSKATLENSEQTNTVTENTENTVNSVT